MILKLFLFLGVQILPLLLGYRLKVVGRAQESWGKPLSLFIIIVMNTAVVLMGAWRLEIHWNEMLRALLVCLLFGLTMTGVAQLMCRIHPHDRPSRGGYIMTIVNSNFGFTMAGFVSYMLYKEDGISFQTIYIFPIVMLLYLFWFPLAQTYGETTRKIGIVRTVLMAMISPNSLPILGTIVGVVLHACGIPMPAFLEQVALPVCVYLGTMLSMFTIGITLQPHSLGDYLPENLSVALTKFLIAPVLGGGLAWSFGIRGQSLAVIVICSTVPVGIFSNFAASIFGLNRNLTNSLFIINTALYLTVILPLLFWLLPVLIPGN